MPSVTDAARPLRAVIVTHGQPGDPDPQQEAVEALAAEVAALLPDARIRGATLAKPGALDRSVDNAVLVYPMFMAEGWFSQSELPRRLAQAGAEMARVLPPFGSDPRLPALCREIVARTAQNQGWTTDETTLLLAAHGSGRSRAPARAAWAMAEALSPGLAQTTCGFIEEAPYLKDAAQNLGARAICLPLFATRAEHVTGDIPEALSTAGFQGALLPPVGAAPEVPRLIAASLRAAHAA